MGELAIRRRTTEDVSYPIARPWIMFGIFVVFALPGSIFAWSAMTEISGAVIGRGIVSVETNIKIVQHLDGGIVSEIRVRNGDHVREGDILLRLDDTAPRASLGIITARLNELYTQKARLDSEHIGATEIAFPADLIKAASTDPHTAALLKAQRSLFLARQDRRVGEQSLLQRQSEQLGEQIRGLTAEYQARTRQSELIDQELESVRPLRSQGLYTQSRFLSLEREAARLKGEIGKLAGDIARMQVAVTETKLKIAQVDKNYLQTILTDLREAEGRIAELEEQRVAAADRLSRIDIRASRSGYVHNLATHTVGGVISPAHPIMEIIPDNDRLIIEAHVPPNDISQIREQQSSTIRFVSFDQKTTPSIQGRVKKISPAQLTDPATGASYFGVIIEVDPQEIARLGPGKHLIPGMPAETFIQTSARTVLSYLMKPLSDALTHAFRER